MLPPTGRRISFRSAAAAETVQYLAAAMIEEAARAAQATDTAGEQQNNNKSNNYIGPPNYLALSSNTNNWLFLVTKWEEWALIIGDTCSAPNRVSKSVDLILSVLDEVRSLVREKWPGSNWRREDDHTQEIQHEEDGDQSLGPWGGHDLAGLAGGLEEGSSRSLYLLLLLMYWCGTARDWPVTHVLLYSQMFRKISENSNCVYLFGMKWWRNYEENVIVYLSCYSSWESAVACPAEP